MVHRRERTNQKARTRLAIVEAALDLHRQKPFPTVADAADAAKVSRATAYRYFPTQEALSVELESRSVNAPIEKLVAQFPSDSPDERLEALIDGYSALFQSEEAHIRRALKVYHDTWLRSGAGEKPRLRQGRRMDWLAAALAPLQSLGGPKLTRLKAALALAVGGDSITILTDVVGLDHEEATEILRWVARTLIEASLQENSR